VPRRPLALIALLLLPLALGSCAGTTEPVEGGTLRVLASSLPESVDPQLGQRGEGREAIWLAHLPLLTYAHRPGVAGLRVIPGLAEDMPAIGSGGRTYRLSLHRGLRYSDGEPIGVGDFERAVKRLLLLAPAGVPLPLEIVGAERFRQAGRGDIAGIQSDRRSGEIVIRLLRPTPDFERRLAMPYMAPVPASGPPATVSESPLPASGPYEIRQLEPGRSLTMTRNPHWGETKASGVDVPDGHVDRIAIEVVPSPGRAATEVEENRADLMLATVPAAAAAELEDNPNLFRYEAEIGTRQPTTLVSEPVDINDVIYNPIFGHDLTSFQFRE
jgi:peptide/nickel transport system substrate-binding protein